MGTLAIAFSFMTACGQNNDSSTSPIDNPPIASKDNPPIASKDNLPRDPAELYVELEFEIACSGKDVEEVVNQYMISNVDSRSFVRRLRQSFSSKGSRVITEYCDNWNRQYELEGTRARELPGGKWRLLGQTLSGIYQPLPGVHVMEFNNGTRRVVAGDP